MDTTFEERSVIVQLISLVLVLGGYLVVAGMMMSSGIQPLTAYLPLFGGAVGLLVVVLVVGHIVALFFGRPERHDERDRLINWRADSIASHVLAGGILIAIIGMVCEMDSVWVAHFLLLTLILHELFKLSLQLIFYRRGVS
ncbi:MAG: hypothetical protein Kow00105_06690 [Phycisphaeraceae bacterium]